MKKNVRTRLTPIQGRFRRLYADVDGAVVIDSAGEGPQEAAIQASNTLVRVLVEGEPGAIVHCVVEADYGDSLESVEDSSRELDDTGRYEATYTIVPREEGLEA